MIPEDRDSLVPMPSDFLDGVLRHCRHFRVDLTSFLILACTNQIKADATDELRRAGFTPVEVAAKLAAGIDRSMQEGRGV